LKHDYKKGIGLGTIFFVAFWLTFDNLALGIGLGVAMGVALSETPEPKKNSENNVSDNGT
jgi:hypothetical protein